MGPDFQNGAVKRNCHLLSKSLYQNTSTAGHTRLIRTRDQITEVQTWLSWYTLFKLSFLEYNWNTLPVPLFKKKIKNEINISALE